jgi:hypothetical protein
VNDVLTAISAEDIGATMQEEFERGMADFKDYVETQMPDLVAAYDELEHAPARLGRDAATVRDFTVEIVETMSGFETIEDWEGLEGEFNEADALEAGQATLRLNQASRAQCGVTIAD